MALTTRDGLIAAQAFAQSVRIFKTVSRGAAAASPESVFDVAGEPGAGTLAGTSTTAGVIPTGATAGCPVINAFVGSNRGYISRVHASNAVSCRLGLYDMLWKAGAYSFNSNVTLSSQPSFASRVSYNGGAADYKGLELFVEAVTAFTGNMSIAVTYTNQDGTTARTTGTVATGITPILGRMIRLPLQAGDTGIQKVESVVATVATVGTFNLLILRKLWEGRIRTANDQIVHGPDLTGLPEVFADSALIMVVTADSTATSTPELVADIINA